MDPLNKMSFTHEPTEFMGHTPPCVCVVRTRGGLEGEMQFSPDSCILTLAVVGILPGMSIDSVIDDVSHTVSDFLKDHSSAGFSVRQVPDSLFVCGTEPVPELEEPNISISKAYKQILGGQPVLNRKNAFNDTIRFREAGVNAVTFGSGEDGWAPVNESISITKSTAATKIFALTIMHLLGVAESGAE